MQRCVKLTLVAVKDLAILGILDKIQNRKLDDKTFSWLNLLWSWSMYSWCHISVHSLRTSAASRLITSSSLLLQSSIVSSNKYLDYINLYEKWPILRYFVQGNSWNSNDKKTVIRERWSLFWQDNLFIECLKVCKKISISM